MAHSIPAEFKRREERCELIKIHRKITDKDIESFVGKPFMRIALQSTDSLYVNEYAQELQNAKVNEIATAIVGRTIYGPAFLITAKELAQ